MSEIVFLKLGGSLITEKDRPYTLRTDVCRRLGEEIREVLAASDLRLLLGHGAGSFAHVPAAEHRTGEGLAGGGGWKGYAKTRRAVTALSGRLLDAFAAVDFHPLAVTPSSCARAFDGRLVEMDLRIVRALLDAGQTPMVCGDALLDDRRGFTICSTESIFEYAARAFHPTRVLLACDVDGVFAGNPAKQPEARRIPVVTESNLAEVLDQAQVARGADVTGGMAGKLRALAEIAALPGVHEARIFSGLVPGAVRQALVGGSGAGTVVR